MLSALMKTSGGFSSIFHHNKLNILAQKNKCIILFQILISLINTVQDPFKIYSSVNHCLSDVNTKNEDIVIGKVYNWPENARAREGHV